MNTKSVLQVGGQRGWQQAEQQTTK